MRPFAILITVIYSNENIKIAAILSSFLSLYVYAFLISVCLFLASMYLYICCLSIYYYNCVINLIKY